MGKKIINYIKAIALFILLLEAVSPHHHHTKSYCCHEHQCNEIPANQDCQTSQTGETVIIFSGEKAICPNYLAIVPAFFLLCIFLFNHWRENFSLILFSQFSRWFLTYHPEKLLYKFHLISYTFLRPPPASAIALY